MFAGGVRTGEGGIRTHGDVAATPAFEAGALDQLCDLSVRRYNFDGAGGTRTHGLPFRKRLLYPPELQPQIIRMKRRTRNGVPMPDVVCLNCQTTFQKRPYQIKKSPNHFCSRKCASGYNNRLFPKRRPEGCCKACAIRISARRTYCRDCWDKQRVQWSAVTLAELRAAAKYQAYAFVRTLARVAYKKSGQPACCANCGYAKTYDVAHKKAISAHDPDTPVATINRLDNLVALCPNCHWEFDHGLLAL